MRANTRRLLIGAIYFVAGVAFLVATWSPTLAAIDWQLWALFTLAFVILSFRSVEVNDRLYASSSVMPILTVGVVLSIDSSAPGIDFGVVFALAAMGALGPLVPEDFRSKRFLQPAVNFGQLTLGAGAVGLVLEVLLQGVSSFSLTQTGDLLRVALAGLVAAFAYSAVNVTLVRMAIVLTYGRRDLLPWSGMTNILGSQTLMGLLGGILGALLLTTSASVVPLILVVYVMGHLVVVSYAQLREAHESTLRGFVKTLETRDLYTRGHTERVAYFCRLIGEQLGFTGTQLERIRWAALIHDVGKLAVPVEVMRKRGKLEDDEYRQLRIATHKVDDLMGEVDFLRPMVEIASGCHPRLTNEDFGQESHTHTSQPNLEQKVLAVADAFDAMTSTRSYRMATSQDRAVSVMLDDDHPLYDNDVVEALVKALDQAGERYGPIDILGTEDYVSQGTSSARS